MRCASQRCKTPHVNPLSMFTNLLIVVAAGPLRQTRLHVPGHGRRRLDPDLATRPGYMIHGARLAPAAWSEVMESRNRTVPWTVPLSDGMQGCEADRKEAR